MNSRNCRAIALAVLVFTGFAVFADAALASTASPSGGNLPGVSALQQLRDFVTGPFAYTVSVLAFVAAGAGLVFGGNDMGAFVRTLLYLGCVVSFIVFATNFLSTMFSGATIPDEVVWYMGSAQTWMS